MTIRNQEGIELDSIVVTEKGLVGRVSEVGVFSCKVLTITDPNSRIPAKLQSNNHHIVVVGDGNKNLSIISDQSQPFMAGDLITTSGIGGIYPMNIPIAKITGFSKDGKPIAKPSVDFSLLDYVMVIKDANKV